MSAGLSSAEAARRLAADGPNRIARQEATPAWRMLARQLASPLVWLLLGACVVSAALGEVPEAIAIGAIVVLNAIVGFFQEHRAERAVLALRALTAPRARVVRDGRAEVVPADQIVRGDLLQLEAGDVIAADARLLAADALSTVEAALTGESLPSRKSTEPAPSGAPLAERTDHVFMGTAVATGTGHAEVVATGMRTELGRIAHLLSTAQREATPLQQRLARVSRVLLFLCLGIVAAVAAIGLVRGRAVVEVFISGVALAVAAVPEGLPAIVTIALALGVQRMAAQNALIRRLHAVETLGSTTVICTDKTGTLTTGVMSVRELSGPDDLALLDAAAASCDAELGDGGRPDVGDPTEIAILAAAAARRIHRADLERERPRVSVQPFDPERKRMSVRRADGRIYVKGAVEVIAPRCSSGDVDGAVREAQDMARRGLRVLAVAVGDGAEEQDLLLVGVVGIADPPREEAKAAIAAARDAGITTVMITGDHPATAQAIARELGLVREGEPAAERVHARATPEDKLRIVRDWKQRGAVVAMTGDGVNDAPALREAHIGIAMGKTGTEVTREASDMVLADDDFATIVTAVEEGRRIFDNLQKTLVYLLTGNAGELALMLVAAIAGLPLPLVPLALLWINLVTDGLPALALVTESAEGDIMKRPPRGLDEPMLGRREWARILGLGVLEGAVVLALFAWALPRHGTEEARGIAFTALVACELFRAFAARSNTRVFWELGAFTNLRLVGVVALSVLLQLAIVHVPLAQELLGVAAPSAAGMTLALAAGLIPVTVLEVGKLLLRRARPRAAGPVGAERPAATAARAP